MKIIRHINRLVLCCLLLLVLAASISGCSLRIFNLSDDILEIESLAPTSKSSYSVDKYVYNTLSSDMRDVYDDLYKGLKDMDESIRVPSGDEEVLSRALEAVLADHSEIFYIDGYSYYAGGLNDFIGIKVLPNYTMTRSKRDDTMSRIEAVADEWLSTISIDASDYDKSKWVYETLINNVDYVAGSPDNQNIISVFLNGQTVCQGYSCAANYLLERLGIQSFVVTGYANGGLHAWNCVRLDGDYYYMDVTWGNTRYTNYEGQKDILYATLNVTSEDILRTHQIESKFTVPECTAINDNYYYMEGCYFDSFEPEKVGRIIHNGYVRRKDVSIKCADSETYNRTKKYIIDDKHFTDYISFRTLQYTMYRDEGVIVFHFK